MRKNIDLQSRIRWPFLALSIALAVVFATPANSCPFCSAIARTFTEQMDSSDIVVVATLQTQPSGEDQTRLPRARFQVANILKGQISEKQEFEAVVVSRKLKIGDHFLVMGSGTDTVNWTTPLKVSETVVDYLKQLGSLPEKGVDRLAFFASFFEHAESVLAYDAYDEFARAPYADVVLLADRLDRDKLIEWINDVDVMKSRKRLYYTLLGVCGTENEIEFLEEIIRSGDRDRQSGLDALIACYLTLKGDEGMPLIESTFLNNADAEYIDVFSAITALRFHGTESDKVTRPRIVQALRFVLDRPKMADMVIPDLARWEDWSVMDRLVDMFRECDTDETRWVRTPIISYLQACPKPEAKRHIATLREIDPEAARRADMLADLDWGDDDEDEDEGEEDEGSENDGEKDGDNQAGGDSGPATAGEKSGDSSDVDRQADLYDDQPINELPTNPDSISYVSTGSPVVATEEAPNANEQLAQRSGPVPPVAVIVPASPSVLIMILVSLGVCGILLVLLWSVLNGSFERLIF